VEATLLEDEAPESYVRWKIVAPRMAQAAEVQMKMKTMAMIFLVMLSLLNKVLVRITRHPRSRCKKFSVSSEKLFESTLYRKVNKQKKRGG
jgi:hypothetical protein